MFMSHTTRLTWHTTRVQKTDEIIFWCKRHTRSSDLSMRKTHEFIWPIKRHTSSSYLYYCRHTHHRTYTINVTASCNTWYSHTHTNTTIYYTYTQPLDSAKGNRIRNVSRPRRPRHHHAIKTKAKKDGIKTKDKKDVTHRLRKTWHIGQERRDTHNHHLSTTHTSSTCRNLGPGHAPPF